MITSPLNHLKVVATLMIALLLNACSSIGLSLINGPSHLLNDMRSERSIPYGDRPDQKLDLFFPNDQNANKNTLIVFVYGGGWSSGTKEGYYFVADALTAEGYSVAIPDYAKYPEAQFPVFVKDTARAVAWLAANAREHTSFDQIVLMGHSAGAHTSALLITDPTYLETHNLSVSDIHGFIGLAGPYGFTPTEERYQRVFANLDSYGQMQPLHFVHGQEPRMLLLHGEKDETVRPANTRKFADKVNANGGTATTRFYAERAHVDIVLALSRVFDSNNQVLDDILGFLQEDT